MFSRCLGLFIISLIIIRPSIAVDDIDPDAYPTHTLITQTELPPLDRVEIAERLSGVSSSSLEIASVPDRQLGNIETFSIASASNGGIARISAELRAIGESVYIWVESDSGISDASATQLAQRFDRDVINFVQDLWGGETLLGIDGEARIHLVITNQLRSGLGGYFSASNSFPSTVVPLSNEKDMLVLSSTMLADDLDVAISSSAHEFLHLLHFSHDLNEENWLNEGYATLTEYLLGVDQPTFFIDAFVNAPQTALTHWGTSDNRRAEYGAPMLFMLYLYDRFGEDALQQLIMDDANGLQSIDAMLSHDESTVDDVFADWVVANLMRQDDSRYGYQSLNYPTPMLLQAIIPDTGTTFMTDLQAYGTHYYRYFSVPSESTISITMADSVSLIPTVATSGDLFWYSQTGDASNPRLTRRFDLREVTEASLAYNIWYDLETEWDYAYVSISVDEGLTWELQSAQSMTGANTNGRAYGIGYTGRLREWRTESISLNNYVGQNILVRFEMVTDDAIHFGGIAIDDVRLDAITYASSFETDDGGWQSEGWIRTDNRLPSRAWVQVIEELPEDVRVHRILADSTTSLTVDFDPTTVRVYLAISPVAPMTMETVTYTLQVE